MNPRLPHPATRRRPLVVPPAPPRREPGPDAISAAWGAHVRTHDPDPANPCPICRAYLRGLVDARDRQAAGAP